MALRDQLRVLVVDDMSTSRGLLTQALDSMGIQHVDATTDGVSALHHLKKKPAHLIISDYNMPEMDGLRLLQYVRHDPATRNTGFILVTGRADPQIIGTGKQLGMNNFLKKPFTPIEMRACIEAVVGKL